VSSRHTKQEAAMMPTSTYSARSTSRPSPALARTLDAGDRMVTNPDARKEDGRAIEPLQMDLFALVRRCLAESERFYRGQPHDTRFSYELFRRALVDRDEIAWEQIYTHCSPLVESWVRRSGAFASS